MTTTPRQPGSGGESRSIARLTASDYSARLRNGSLTVEAIARACLDIVAERDPIVKAWSFVDPDRVIRLARELDGRAPLGPLYGIPIGVKDMIDTFDMPTQHNSPIYAGHRPGQDAACVTTVRAQGALIFGKTDTTEFAAAGRMAATRNPHDPSRTPGGSSSGSAAAVADLHVPLALGTQTGGSTIRPASFCGTFGFKPTWGAVSREGLKLYSLTLDTLGWFARSVDDLCILADAFGLRDDLDPRPVAAPALRIAACRSPAWPSAEPGLDTVVDTAIERLRRAGATVTERELPPAFNDLGDMHRIVLHSEGRAAFRSLALAHGGQLHDDFLAQVENRSGITRRELLGAYDHAARCRTEFDDLAASYDAILTPSAPGEAPLGDRPGDPAFNRIWTLLHVPCVNVPGLRAPSGMPIGLTLAAARFRDRHLLEAARAVAPILSGPG